MKRLLFILAAIVAFGCSSGTAIAETSENYAMESSSVTGAGNTSTSETHMMHDSLAESVTETHNSANYILHSGHCAVEGNAMLNPVPEIITIILVMIGLTGLGISLWYVRRKRPQLQGSPAV